MNGVLRHAVCSPGKLTRIAPHVKQEAPPYRPLRYDGDMTTPPKLSPLVSLVNFCLQAHVTTVIAIDGIGGSGKSTLARAMQEIDPSFFIVPLDDFYRGLALKTPLEHPDEVGSQIDWRRLVDQVLIPLNRDEPGRYQRFDWDTQALAEWHDVPIDVPVLIEGVYSARKELTDYLDIRIWVETPADISLERGITRDGEPSREWWLNHWLEDERRYAAERHADPLYADIVIDGTDGQTHYANGQYARLR